MDNGKWVTLHIQHLGGGEDRTLVGYLVQDGSTPGYKLTKLALTKEEVQDGEFGHLTWIHKGTWIVAPHFVWMVEFEDEEPAAGFVAADY